MKTISSIFFFTVLCCFIKTATQEATTQVDIELINQIRGSTSSPVADHMTCLTYNNTVANQLMTKYQSCNVVPSGNNLAFEVMDTASIAGDWITERFLTWVIDAIGSYNYATNDCTWLSAMQCSNFKAAANDLANSVGCFQTTCSASTTVCNTVGQDCTLTVCQFDVAIPTGRPYVSSCLSPLDTNCMGCMAPSACSLSSMPAKSECTNHVIGTGGCCARSTTSPITGILLPFVDSTNDMNLARSFSLASGSPSLKMTCLVYEQSYQTQVNSVAQSCSPPSPSNTQIIHGFSSAGDSYQTVFQAWVNQNYDFNSQTCASGSCVELLTMLNDNAAKFACAQANCSTTNSIQPLFTVCKFDQPPTNPPYIVGGAGACDQTQCPSTRNTCDMNNLCCYPSTAIPTTLAPTPHSIIANIEAVRQTISPFSQSLLCLDYDNTILEPMAKASASSCAPPTDGATAFSVSSVYQTYLDVFVSWGSEVIGWHWDTQTCDIGFQCDNFRTMMNSLVDKVGCAQHTCTNTFAGETGGPPYFFTVCTFDQPTPTGNPYTPNGPGTNSGCQNFSSTVNTCNSPTKTQCYDSEGNPPYTYCCYPETNPVTTTPSPPPPTTTTTTTKKVASTTRNPVTTTTVKKVATTTTTNKAATTTTTNKIATTTNKAATTTTTNKAVTTNKAATTTTTNKAATTTTTNKTATATTTNKAVTTTIKAATATTTNKTATATTTNKAATATTNKTAITTRISINSTLAPPLTTLKINVNSTLSLLLTTLNGLNNNNNVTPICSAIGGMTTWWCAKDNQDGQTAPSAVQTDSCFCVMFKNQTQREAFEFCSSIGGFLTDIQNQNENDLMGIVMKKAVQSNEALRSLCPPNSVPFNGLCYSFQTKYRNWAEAEKYCQKTFNGHLSSIRINTHQEFLFKTLSQTCRSCGPFGFWVGANRGTSWNPWLWSDNSTFFHMPQKSKLSIVPEDDLNPLEEQCMLIGLDGGYDEIPCYYWAPSVCSFSPPNPSAWIGLEKINSGNLWSVGTECETRRAKYHAIDTISDLKEKAAYVFEVNGRWTAVPSINTASTAICRLDRNICGRNYCPQCSQCRVQNGGRCFTCD